jgi:hypothetical protein
VKIKETARQSVERRSAATGPSVWEQAHKSSKRVATYARRKKQMKQFSRIAALLVLLVASFVPAFAATGVAQLKGTYNFQVVGVQNQYGYYQPNSNTFVVVTNGVCPKGDTCVRAAVEKLTVGTISFDGAGKATFLSIAKYGQGSGGPVKGTVWPYTVSGFNGYLGTAGNGAALSLGSYNSAGIATVVLFLTTDTVPSTGTAVLQ